MVASDVHKRAQKSLITWRDVIDEVIKEYEALKNNSLWIGATNKKEDPVLKALQAEVTKLKSPFKGGSNKTSTKGMKNGEK